MATPKKVNKTDSNKSTATSNKKTLDKPKPAKSKVKPKASRITLELIPPGPCSECDPCAGIPTGMWGISWHDQAGNLRCLPFPGGAPRYLRGDASGPYWSLT